MQGWRRDEGDGLCRDGEETRVIDCEETAERRGTNQKFKKLMKVLATSAAITCKFNPEVTGSSSFLGER